MSNYSNIWSNHGLRQRKRLVDREMTLM